MNLEIEMKKRILLLVYTMLILAFLCACGKETFRCGLCSKTVTQKPHAMTVLGQDIKVCDDCYSALKQFIS